MKRCGGQLLALILLFSSIDATLGAENSSTPAAVLHANGKVQVNGAESTKITTLFRGDSVETDADSVANITAGGSSVLVMPNASVKLLGNMVELTHGAMAISTSAGMSAMAFGLTITPTGQNLSKFEVAEDEDSVVIAARQGEVAVSDGQHTSTIPEGQQSTNKKKQGAGTVPGATGSSFPTKSVAIVGATAAAIAAAGIVLANSSGSKKCISPSGGKPCCTQNQQGNNNCQ